jgi:hypothetical protein
LFFEALKERRGEDYFVEYHPPVVGNSFATLELVVLRPVDTAAIVLMLEAEATLWLQRFPLPLMASAYDSTGALLSLDPLRGNFLCGWRASAAREANLSWDIEQLATWTAAHPDMPDLLSVYAGVAFRTRAQVDSDFASWVRKRRAQVSTVKLVLVGWLALIPAVVAVYEYFGPEWLGFAVLMWTLWKAMRAGLRVAGYAKASARESMEADKRQKMDHYYYHCELNPSGFIRLRTENFAREARQKTQQEADALAKPST